MRRDLDLVRHLLLKLEGEQSYKDAKESAADAALLTNTKITKKTVHEHYLWLFDAGFIEAQLIARAGGYSVVYPRRLTWAGAEYLDCVRDSKIWRETKSKLSAVGSASLPIIQKLAESIIKKVLSI